MQMRGQRLDPLRSFYLVTLRQCPGDGLDGSESARWRRATAADLVVLDARATPQMRAADGDGSTRLDEELFLLQTFGDDRAIVETYVAGRAAKSALAA